MKRVITCTGLTATFLGGCMPIKIRKFTVETGNMHKTLLTLVIALSLSACDNSDIELTQLGEVTLTNSALVVANAAFYEYSEAKTFPRGHTPTGDSCIVFDDDDIGSNNTTTTTTSISAGDVLTVSSPAGSYAELTKTVAADKISYTSDSLAPLTGPAPANLTISIPGDQFPAFTDVAIPNVEVLIVESPAIGTSITPDTAFKWTASTGTESYLNISARHVFADNQAKNVICTAIDDGSFEFPETTKTLLGNDFSGVGSIKRIGRNFLTSGDAGLRVTARSAQAN